MECYVPFWGGVLASGFLLGSAAAQNASFIKSKRCFFESIIRANEVAGGSPGVAWGGKVVVKKTGRPPRVLGVSEFWLPWADTGNALHMYL
jgi:hypothetical protein